jgi:hypothetical protein
VGLVMDVCCCFYISGFRMLGFVGFKLVYKMVVVVAVGVDFERLFV